SRARSPSGSKRCACSSRRASSRATRRSRRSARTSRRSSAPTSRSRASLASSSVKASRSRRLRTSRRKSRRWPAAETPVRLAAGSIDLDEIHHYYTIHGLEGRGRAADAVYDRAVPRAADWAESLGVPLTFFVVGADLARPENVETVRTLA